MSSRIARISCKNFDAVAGTVADAVEIKKDCVERPVFYGLFDELFIVGERGTECRRKSATQLRKDFGFIDHDGY